MEEKRSHIPIKTDTLPILCLAAAIATSALAFSMNVTSFLHIKETALAILLVPLAILSVTQRERTLQSIQQFLPLILLTLIPFLLTILPNFPNVPAIMHREQARLAVLILFAILSFDMFRAERARRHVTNAFLATAVVAALLAYVQHAAIAPWLFPEFEDAIDPLYSTFGNSGLLAGYLAMAIPIAIHRALTSPRFTIPLLIIVAITPALTLTGSRAGWIAATAGTLLIFPYRAIPARRTIATTLLLATCIGATFIQFEEARPSKWVEPEKKDTARLRLWFWDGAIRMTAANPITGVGLGNFQYWSPQYQGDALQSNFPHIQNEAHTQYAHNEPLHLAAETGLIGIALCAWMLIRLTKCRGPEWGGLAAALTFSLFHFPLHSAPHALMIALFAAMLLARKTNPKTEDASKNKADTPHSQNPSLRGESLTACPASKTANDAAISLHGINHTPWTKHYVAITTAIISFTLAAFTTYDVLLPSIALRQANNLHNEGEPANQAYKKAINTGRHHPQAHANYANALLQQGDLKEAQIQLEQALKGQDTADLHLALGYIAVQNGENKLATKHLLAATHRWPKNQTAQQYLQQAVQ